MAPLSKRTSMGGDPSSKRMRTRGKQIRRFTPTPLYQAPRSNPLGGPWPVQKHAQLTYSTLISMTITTGQGNYFMSCNGMYDPDITGTGSQPLYFDQLMELYNHYTVTSSFAEFQPITGSNAVLTVYVDDDTTSSGDAFVCGARPGAKITNMGSVESRSPTIRQGWSGKRLFGPNVLNNSLFRGSSIANPPEQSYYVLVVYDPSLSSYTLNVRVKITFNATFTELKTIGSS